MRPTSATIKFNHTVAFDTFIGIDLSRQTPRPLSVPRTVTTQAILIRSMPHADWLRGSLIGAAQLGCSAHRAATIQLPLRLQ